MQCHLSERFHFFALGFFETMIYETLISFLLVAIYSILRVKKIPLLKLLGEIALLVVISTLAMYLIILISNLSAESEPVVPTDGFAIIMGAIIEFLILGGIALFFGGIAYLYNKRKNQGLP